jgi:AcrR family transcriptional regulator
MTAGDAGRIGRRAMQAEQTRADILAAARRRFGSTGYAATTLKDIAADAGVSVQTVYDSVGSKADLIRRLNDLIDAEARIGEIVGQAMSSRDARVVARTPAVITRRLLERCGDILRACIAAHLAEPELVPVVEEGQRRHREGAAAIAARLSGMGALRPGLEVADAATTVAALSDFRLAAVLLDDHDLSYDELEDWIAESIARTVLRTTRGRVTPAPGSMPRSGGARRQTA